MPEKVRRSKKLGENAAGTLAYDFCADLKKKKIKVTDLETEIFLGTFADLQKQKQKNVSQRRAALSLLASFWSITI